jgi:TetR/AcrR family transcriptional repressor of nem operon
MYNVKQVGVNGGNTMKVSREQAAENRQRVVETAARLFREKGFDGIGVADLMKTAGLTHGGFYGQFSSKEDLAAQACARALADSEKKWERLTSDKGKDPLKALAASYLSARHRDDAGNGCAFVALGAEAPRWGRAVRCVFTEALLARIKRLIQYVPGQSEKARRERAIATMASLVGGLVLARAVHDPRLSDEILKAVKTSI